MKKGWLNVFPSRLQIVLLGCIWLIVAGVSAYMQPHFSDVSFGISGQKILQKKPLPIVSSSDGQKRVYRYQLTLTQEMLEFSSLPMNRFRIVPDDCLQWLVINHRRVDITSITEQQRCDYTLGFTIDLTKYLVPGENKVVAQIQDNGGAYGFNIEHISPLRYASFSVGLVFFWALLCGVLQRFFVNIHAAEKSILLLANALFFYWMQNTDIYYFAQDMSGHLDYIQYIAEHFWLPHPRMGWVFYHPPLFYTLMGGVQAAATAIGVDAHLALRLANLFLFNGFLLVALALVRQSFNKRHWQLLAFALVCLWPLGIRRASITDGNTLLYLLALAACYFLLRWYQHSARKDLIWAMILLGLAIATRSNAYVLLPVFAVVMAVKYWQKDYLLRDMLRVRILLAVLVVLAGISINTGRILYHRYQEHNSQSLIIGNSDAYSEGSPLWVMSDISRFVVMDIKAYFEQPLFRVAEPFSDRSYFWNGFLKSMSFGEYGFTAMGLASVLNLCVLVFFLLTWVPVLGYTVAQWQRNLPHLLVALAGMGGLMLNRYMVPIAPSGDFRYAYFILVPMVVLFVSHVAIWAEQRKVTLLLLSGVVTVAIPVLGAVIYIQQIS